MKPTIGNFVETTITEIPARLVSYVPTPTREYRVHKETERATVEPTAPPAPSPIPAPAQVPTGARVLLWRQDGLTGDLSVRKAFVAGSILPGPRDARIAVQGVPPVSRNAMGDFIPVPGTEAFDAVHTFVIVRQTLNLYQRALGSPLPWQWNTGGNTDPLNVFPRGLPDTMNALYSREYNALKFGDFIQPGAPPHSPRLYTCRSQDLVAHETGHALLDGLKPGWLSIHNPPQTSALHEAFADLTAIFLTLTRMDQVEALITQTKANLHAKAFLSDLAEAYGLALGRPNGLRNANNDFKLGQVGSKVHAISEVFTGATYDILADIFAFERQPSKKDDTVVLHEAAQYLCGLILRAIIQAPDTAATYADVVNQMIQITTADGQPAPYRNFIRNRFVVREAVASLAPLTVDHTAGTELVPAVKDERGAIQNRSRCCGTMQHPEYTGMNETLEQELVELREALARSAWKSAKH